MFARIEAFAADVITIGTIHPFIAGVLAAVVADIGIQVDAPSVFHFHHVEDRCAGILPLLSLQRCSCRVAGRRREYVYRPSLSAMLGGGLSGFLAHLFFSFFQCSVSLSSSIMMVRCTDRKSSSLSSWRRN